MTMIPVYTITYQLLRSTAKQYIDFTSNQCVTVLRDIENFVNSWPESKPCNLKVLLDRQDVNYVYELLVRFLDNHSPSPPLLPSPEDFPVSTPDKLNITVLYDSTAVYTQREVDKILHRFEQVAAARHPFSSFRIGNRLFSYVSHTFHVKLTTSGNFIPK